MTILFDNIKDNIFTPIVNHPECNKTMKIHSGDLDWLRDFGYMKFSTLDNAIEKYDKNISYLIYCDVKNSDYVFGKISTIFDYLTTKQKRFLHKRNVGILFSEIREGWKEEYLKMIYDFCEKTHLPTEKINYATSCENMKTYLSDMGYTDSDDKHINILYHEYWFDDTRKWFKKYIEESNDLESMMISERLDRHDV